MGNGPKDNTFVSNPARRTPAKEIGERDERRPPSRRVASSTIARSRPRPARRGFRSRGVHTFVLFKTFRRVLKTRGLALLNASRESHAEAQEERRRRVAASLRRSGVARLHGSNNLGTAGPRRHGGAPGGPLAVGVPLRLRAGRRTLQERLGAARRGAPGVPRAPPLRECSEEDCRHARAQPPPRVRTTRRLAGPLPPLPPA